MRRDRWSAPASGVASWAIAAAVALAACGDVNAVLEQLVDARQVSADLLVQFTRASDAGNRAVMADTDEASVAFAHEADRATASVQKDIDTLGPMLQGLKYAEESRLLEQFAGRFAEYRKLDRQILDLAVENTNLKAQRLAFGPAQEAADAFRDALEAIVSSGAGVGNSRVDAIAARAELAVREIQVTQSPHIASADDAAMTAMEGRMAALEKQARGALASLAPLVDPSSRARLGAATEALDRFMKVNAELVALSRRNTNVRSLALSLEQKRALVAPCEESLHALQDALAKRSHVGGRWP